MGILKRVNRLIKANINTLIEKAEDPEKTLKQCIRDMEEGLRETRGKVAEVVAGQRMFLRKKDREEAEVGKWERRAFLAVQKGQEDLAKEAVLKKRSHDLAAVRLSAEADRQGQNVDLLKTTMAALQAKLVEAKEKQDFLIARKRQADIKKGMLDHIEGVATASSNVDTSAFQAFERAEQRIMAMEAEAEARLEQETEGPVPSPVAPRSNEQKFREMEDEDYIAAELDRLRAKARMTGKS
jgi:phage shock protein A